MASALDLYRGLGLEYAPDRYLDLSLKGFGEGGGGDFAFYELRNKYLRFHASQK